MRLVGVTNIGEVFRRNCFVTLCDIPHERHYLLPDIGPVDLFGLAQDRPSAIRFIKAYCLFLLLDIPPANVERCALAGSGEHRDRINAASKSERS